MLHKYDLFNGLLGGIAPFKTSINILNAHLFNAVRKDTDFRRTALINGSNVLLPGGTDVVWATKMFAGQKMKNGGDDLFESVFPQNILRTKFTSYLIVRVSYFYIDKNIHLWNQKIKD